MSKRLVPRIGDIPYWDSPPMQFTLTMTAVLDGGTFKFLDAAGGSPLAPVQLNGTKNLTESSLVYIYDFSFAADIPVLDYQQAIQLAGGATDIPSFFTFLKSDAGSPQFKDPVELYNYIDKQPYKLLFDPKVSDNSLTGFFRGEIAQTAALAGITEVNYTVNLYAQEITNEAFIKNIKKNYPQDFEV